MYNNIDDLLEAIDSDTEWLKTIEGDEIECISIENLETILSYFFNKTIKLSHESN